MALLEHQLLDPAGTKITFAAAASGGDTYKVDDDKSILLVKNDDAAAKTVTLVTPGTVRGLAIPDRQVTVDAGSVEAIPLYRDLYRDPADGLVDITYSAVTSTSVAVVRPV